MKKIANLLAIGLFVIVTGQINAMNKPARGNITIPQTDDPQKLRVIKNHPTKELTYPTKLISSLLTLSYNDTLPCDNKEWCVSAYNPITETSEDPQSDRALQMCLGTILSNLNILKTRDCSSVCIHPAKNCKQHILDAIEKFYNDSRKPIDISEMLNIPNGISTPKTNKYGLNYITPALKYITTFSTGIAVGIGALKLWQLYRNR